MERPVGDAIFVTTFAPKTASSLIRPPNRTPRWPRTTNGVNLALVLDLPGTPFVVFRARMARPIRGQAQPHGVVATFFALK
jgi:hypothetical protein